MKRLFTKITKHTNQSWTSLILILSPLLLFVFLTIRVDPQKLVFFSRYSVLMFFIVLILYYFTFRIQGKVGLFSGLALTMVLFAVVLLFKWESGYSDTGIIGGLLPYKDGKNYYWGTQLLLNGQLISAVSNQSAGRPLHPGFLSIFLVLTKQNYQWATVIISGLAGLTAYMSARPIVEKFGPLAASIYITLLYFYIQPLIGRPLSEFPGYIFGCLGFILLWRAATNLSLIDLILGLFTLMMAVSIRSGAFFVFPMLFLWAGFVFRGDKRFSYKVAGIALFTIGFSFLLMNVIYPRLIVGPDGVTNGNFAYALYGQVRGGLGYNAGIKDLGTRDPSVVYAAAFDFFTRHPMSFFIGAAKAYRDFFLPNRSGFLPLMATLSHVRKESMILWFLGLFFLVVGLIHAIRNYKNPIYSLLAAGFVGIFFSIPFLPPMDGGRDFYASTMPFIYVPISIAPLILLRHKARVEIHTAENSIWFERLFPVLLAVLTMLIPTLLQQFISPPSFTAMECPSGQRSFVGNIHPNSYIELVSERSEGCGFAPLICLEDFQQYSAERSTDDVYQELESLAQSTTSNTWIIPFVDLVDSNFHYMVDNTGHLDMNRTPPFSIQGCADEIKTKNQSIYLIKSLEIKTIDP